MLKKIATIISLVILSGCVNTRKIPIDDAKVQLKKPETILISQRNKPIFAANSAIKDSLGLLGALASAADGNSIVLKNKVEDPASSIGSELMKGLSNKYNIDVIKSEVYVDSQDMSDLVAAYPDTDWILDIETVNWGFSSFPSFLSQTSVYRVTYGAKLRLIDTRDKTLVAEGFCSSVPKLSGLAPTYNELLANNAERLKSELNFAAYNCIDMFTYEVLKL